MTPSLTLDLYRCSELLQRSCLQFELQGNADGAAKCREAACSVMLAISAAVKERAEAGEVVQ